jgi:hypothetical protein
VNWKKPEFHLTSIYGDGRRSEPQIIPVTDLPWKTVMDRRSSLGMGLGLTGVLAAISTLSREAQAHYGRCPRGH